MNIEKPIHEKISSQIEIFRSEMTNSNFGSIPEFVIEFVISCKKILKKLKTETDTSNEIYVNSSEKVVFVATNVLVNWTKACDAEMAELKFVPIEGMKHGNNYYEICEKTIQLLNNFETGVTMRTWFEQHKSNLIPKIQNDGGCFIATACYDNYDHPKVIQLRYLRDNYLKERKWGIKFIEIYYKHSPKYARIIAKNNFLKYTSKNLLVKPLYHFSKMLK
jgi:hypothetical protein